MPDRVHLHIPRYRLHKPTGLAVVRLSGRDTYLGRFGSPESEAKYQAAIANWLKNDRKPPRPPEKKCQSVGLVVDELILAYLDFAKRYYVKNGEPTGEITNIEDAMRYVSERFGSCRVSSFDPSCLRKVRDMMIAGGLCRNVINARVNRIRRMFKWGVEHQRVDAPVLLALQAVAPLRRGRSSARETEPVRPVSEHLIKAVLKNVPRQISAMIQLQRFTGMRPGEVTLMRSCDLDMSGRIWVYRPSSHKTEHHGRRRDIYLGPQAQELIRPFLKSDLKAYLFSPREVLQALRKKRNAARKSRPTPSELMKRKKARDLKVGVRYTRRSYAQTIARGCRKAFPVPEDSSIEEQRKWNREHHWSPNQLRHNAATFLRKQFGIEAARVVLGHSSAAVTEIYAEIDEQKAADIMEKVG